MKLYLIEMPIPTARAKTPFGYDSGELFTINKWYEGDLTPICMIHKLYNRYHHHM